MAVFKIIATTNFEFCEFVILVLFVHYLGTANERYFLK